MFSVALAKEKMAHPEFEHFSRKFIYFAQTSTFQDICIVQPYIERQNDTYLIRVFGFYTAV